jgi:hypothetical protein
VTGGGNSDRLLATIGLVQPILAHESERLWNAPEVRRLYPTYLQFLHMIVRSAVPLLITARDRARALSPGDRLAAALVDYFDDHAREEAGHDEWLRHDLAAISEAADHLLAAPPPASVAAYVGAQYYWIHHYHPVALLGHVAALEAFHPDPGFADRLRRLTGYPKAAFRAIARHEILDQRHKQELCAFLDSIELTADQQTILGMSALHTVQSAVEVLRSIHPPGPSERRADGTERHEPNGTESAHPALV